ncbi:recombinase [Rhodoferax sp.]|uniref:site-specific recombinase n=1 Tax=Rhodoferax sp. TaxID=50421 RepID=UPI0025FB498C|nr:recombinase [Rhodoferax sp.]
MTTHTLTSLLDTLDADAPLAQRHLWLIGLLDWIRGDNRAPDDAVSRVQRFLGAVEARLELQVRLRTWWKVLADTVDSTMVLSDYGFSPRTAFFSELGYRLRCKILPSTPETTDAAELFSLVLPNTLDAAWLAALDAATLARIGDLLSSPSRTPGITLWQDELLQAITFCSNQIMATGVASELRLRMSAAARHDEPFNSLSAEVDALRRAFIATPRELPELEAAAQRLRERLELCRQAAASVYPHLNDHGISVNLVFMLRQLRERLLRVRDLMDCLLSPTPDASASRLVVRLAYAGQERRSLRALVRGNASMLAAKVTERSAETGEHYITRDRSEYRGMLVKAAGGGAATSLTTLLKFLIGAVGLTAFWAGMWSGVMYAASFVMIQLLHWTLATKQPAMTAPAMAAKLKDLGNSRAIEEFVDEVTHLVRSQVAAVLGNVGMVTPCVLLISFAMFWVGGKHMVSRVEADHVFQTLSLLSPSTLLFAAFTGVLLFVASLIAGAVENWFVLHQLDSALRYNPRITRVLGVPRADRWARFMREHISGFASNISLGFMLGLLPPVLAFVGLGLEARHVTLSTGQLAAAAAAYGNLVWKMPVFWWCVAAIPLIGVLNLTVSFFLALQLALGAHSVTGLDRQRLRYAVLRRLRQHPLSFVWPRARKSE